MTRWNIRSKNRLFTLASSKKWNVFHVSVYGEWYSIKQEYTRGQYGIS